MHSTQDASANGSQKTHPVPSVDNPPQPQPLLLLLLLLLPLPLLALRRVDIFCITLCDLTMDLCYLTILLYRSFMDKRLILSHLSTLPHNHHPCCYCSCYCYCCWDCYLLGTLTFLRCTPPDMHTFFTTLCVNNGSVILLLTILLLTILLLTILFLWMFDGKDSIGDDD